MSDLDALDERLRAVERRLTDTDDGDLTDLRDAVELSHELESLSAHLDDLADRVDELEAATQALRGYVGNVRAVNQSVERTADAALAKAEEIEAEVLDGDGSDGTAPCGCRTRRSGVGDDERNANRDADWNGTGTADRNAGRDANRNVGSDGKRNPDSDAIRNPDSDDDRGLLARIAESL